jgi:probable HAF family extracellular repeat protein
MQPRTAILAVTAMLLAAGSTHAEAQQYSAVDIGSLGGSGATIGNAINNAGTVVGASYKPNGDQHAFSYSNGTMTDLGTLGGPNSSAAAVNAEGTIVGYSSLANGNAVAISYSNGKMTEIKVNALQGYTSATGINNAGVVVGSGYVNAFTTAQPFDGFISNNGAVTIISNPGGTVGASGINSAGTVAGGYALNYSNFYYDPFTFSNGTFTSLGAFGQSWVTYALAINDSGTVVGYYSDANTNQGSPHAFSFSNGSFTALGTLPGGSNSNAEAINNSGVIVGDSTFTNSNGTYHAIVYSNGIMTDLNLELTQPLPTILTNATAINDVGQIVTVGANGDTYLLSPAPALVSLAVFGTGYVTGGPGFAPVGTADGNYKLLSCPAGACGSEAFVTLTDQYPFPCCWLANTTTALWIGPDSGGNEDTVDSPGVYDYEESFDLTGFDPSTVTLTGSFATDNTGYIQLNGVTVGPTNASSKTLTPFTLTSGFNQGINTIDFFVTNGPTGGAQNPTGLFVELSGTGQQTGKTTPTITWPTPAAITYGTPLSGTQLDASSAVAGTFVYAPPSGTVLKAGLQNLSVTFTPTDTTDYATATASVTLLVNQAKPAIIWAIPAPITYGTALSATQLDASSGGLAGTFVYTPAAGAVLPAGVQTLSVTFTPADTTDYTTATATVQLTVNPAVLTVTANNASMPYGGPIPTLTYAITGYENGDGSSVVGGTAMLTTTATITSPPGAGYPITFVTEALTATNYTFAYVPGTLTVTQASQTISFNPTTPVIYGVPPITLIATGGASGNPVTFTYISGPGSLSGANNSILTVSGAGNIVVEACQAGNTDYAAATCMTKTIVVNPAVLTVTANNASMPYGGPIPTLTYAITGYVNGDGSSVVSGTATLSTTATITSPVVAGGYPITFATEALRAANYTFVYVSGTLTVTQASQTISFNPATPVTYGVSPITLSATGGASGNPVTFAYVSGPGSLSGTNDSTLTVTGAGNIMVEACQTGNTNFAPATCVTKTIVVNPAVLTVTANNASMPYGGPIPNLTYGITSYVNGDGSSVVSGTASLTTTATIASPVVAGGYPITFATENLTAANYTFIYVPGTLTVIEASQTITFNPATPVTYGVPPITLIATGGASGNPVTFTYISGPGSLSGANDSTLTVTGAGNIMVEACQTGNTNFAPATCVTKTIVVNQAVLTVSANNASMPYGGPIPTMTYGISGYVNGDGSSVVSGTATLTTTATITSPAGAGYPITFVTEALVAASYSFAYVPGTLTVQQVPVNVDLVSSSISIPAGSPFTLTATVQSTTSGTPTGTVTFYNGVNGFCTVSLLNGVAACPTSLLTLGTYTFTTAFAGNTDFLAGTSNPVSVNVLPATTTTVLSASPNPAPLGANVTFSATVSSLAGTPQGSVSFEDGGVLIGTGTLASGVATFSTNTLAEGSHNIVATYAGATAYAPSTSATVVEIIVDFGISASPDSRTLYTGEAATYTVSVTADSGFNLPVSLACSALPANTTCTFSPANISGGSGVFTLTVQTTAPSQTQTAFRFSAGYRVVALAGLFLVFIPRRLRRFRKGWPLLLTVVAFLAAGTAITGCSGPRSLVGGTPVGAQTITITGTAAAGSQTVSHQTSVTLNVNSLF